jgi:septum formation protein
MSQPERLILASASPRRLELLRGLGLRPSLRPSSAPEEARPGESPRELVLRLARDKGRSVIAALAPWERPGVVLAADTEVVLDRDVLGCFGPCAAACTR